jgi:hypothetical protein
MSACCDGRKAAKTPTLARRCREVGAWALPTTMLALMPKCPACVAAYVAVWSGLGLSLGAATFLRTALLLLLALSLLYLILTRLVRFLVAGGSKREE